MPSVLVTGPSTGIGRATALRLDRAGWQVFAGVRRQEDAESLRAAGSARLAPLTLDITDGEQIAAAAARIEAEADGGLDGLVNNAGVAIPGPLETLSIGAYHAAKFGIEAVGDIFRQELRPWGISVSIVEPGSIDTPIWERGERTADEIATPEREALYGEVVDRYRKVIRDTAERGIAAEKVAKVIEHALSADRPRSRYLVGLEAKLVARLKLLLPTRVFDRIVARQMNL